MRRALVVDDDAFVASLLIKQLAALGLGAAQPFTQAREALALVEQDVDCADIIFCDLQMPDLDGIELVRGLANAGFAGDVVLVSGEDHRLLKTAERLALAQGLRVLGALAKPVTLDALRAQLAVPRSPARVAPARRGRDYAAAELEAAIRSGQLVNHYQPKVDVGSGKVLGMEALVRWQHPQDGLVFPDRFIGLAERELLIDDLMRVVLREALRHARAWFDAGLDLHVAVNVSMDNLSSLTFPEFAADLAKRAGVPLEMLMMEVTESRLPHDPLMLMDILTRLRLKGIALSIDDFGTGHSSLENLRDLPFAELKIDRGFVHGAQRDSSRRAILVASVAMAREHGMLVTAEGVEDDADWGQVRDAGCDLAQGWLIARAMPVDAVNDWMRAYDAKSLRLRAS